MRASFQSPGHTTTAEKGSVQRNDIQQVKCKKPPPSSSPQKQSGARGAWTQFPAAAAEHTLAQHSHPSHSQPPVNEVGARLFTPVYR